MPIRVYRNEKTKFSIPVFSRDASRRTGSSAFAEDDDLLCVAGSPYLQT